MITWVFFFQILLSNGEELRGYAGGFENEAQCKKATIEIKKLWPRATYLLSQCYANGVTNESN